MPFIWSANTLRAAEYILNDHQETVIGELGYTRTDYHDTLLDIARRHGLGYQDIKLVNPALDTWLPGEQEQVLLPLQFILPHAAQEGIVLNIPEMRLYYYPETLKDEARKVITYPLGIGREGWNTPYVKTSIIEKITDPAWRPPESIRKEHAEKGEILPAIVKPGPDNPLGAYAMRLGMPSYLIHGTNKPFGIGMRVSHGCIRLYPEDIESLFSTISLGTRVNIVNQPYKVGQKNGRIYLEAHPFLDEDSEQYAGSLTSVVKILVNITEAGNYEIDWTLAQHVIDEMKGVPVEIGAFTQVLSAAQPDDITEVNPDGIKLRMESNLGDAGY